MKLNICQNTNGKRNIKRKSNKMIHKSGEYSKKKTGDKTCNQSFIIAKYVFKYLLDLKM